jgi:integrase
LEALAILLTNKNLTDSLLDALACSVTTGTLRNYSFDLMDFGAYAIANRWIESVALTPADLPGRGRRRPITVYSQAELDLLVTSARGKGLRWWAFLAFLADTGRRSGETLSLRWEWARLDEEPPYFELPVNKSGRPQYVPLGKRLRDEVFTAENVHELRSGRDVGHRFARSPLEHPFPWGYGPASERFKRHCALVGVEYRGFHTMRHTRATEMLAKGVPVHAVSSLLGHSSPAVTARTYDHTTSLTHAHYLDD